MKEIQKIIAFKNENGSCGIAIPTPEALEKLTIEEIASKDVPTGLSYIIIDKDTLPQDRYFRNAWTLKTKSVAVDMDKARDIHLKNIRKERADKFIALGFPVKLDSDLEKAIIPQEKRDILKALRDIPQNIDLSIAKTPEELKTIWPNELK